MQRIAVCDDTREECCQVVELARHFFERRELEIELETYSSMDALLACEKKYDLYFLDVLMSGISGIEGAASLVERYKNPVIVFITSSLESAVDGYRVNAAGFLLKPVNQKDFDETMERVMKQRLNLKEESISVVINRVPVKLQLERVLYFENRLHRVYAILTDGSEFAIGQRLSALQEELADQETFLRCHQSYIVNLEHVVGLQDSCFLMDGKEQVPISRTFYKQSKNAYYHYRLR